MAALQGGGQGMNNLTTLIKRLEAATSRLEDIASSASSFQDQQEAGSHGGIAADGSALQASSSAPELQSAAREASTGTVQRASDPLPPRIEEMDELIAEEVERFVEASGALGEALVEEQASSVAKSFADQRRFLLVTTKTKKPDPQSKAFMDLLSDLQQDMGSVGDIRDSHRASPMKEHLAMVGEGIQALQWLVMEGKPADFVGEVIGGAQMYGNRVLKAYKEKDQAHVKFVQSYYALLQALQAYIKKHYPSGVTWNANGSEDAVAAYRAADSATPTTNGVSTPVGGAAPPPPPPPPPLPNFDNAPPPPPPGPAPTSKGGAGDMGAVFEQLNQGESVTKGLKKVDKSQMTHKNPSLRAGGTVPDNDNADISRSRSPGPEIKPKPPSMRQTSSASKPGVSALADGAGTKKPSRKELDGTKWLIENFTSPSSPIEVDVTLTQSVLVSNCTDTTILLRGKANALSIDNSPRTQLRLDSLVSSVDVIKCPRFALQVVGAVPSVLLDQVDGATVYLSAESVDAGTEVLSSKCSAINIILPPREGDGEDADSVECPLPEQIRSFVKDGRVVSEIVEHAG